MRIVGQEEVAKLFGVTAKTIGEWQHAGFPVLERGGDNKPSVYDSAACIWWDVQRKVQKASAPETPQDRLWRLQADGLEHQLAKERARLIPAGQLNPLLDAASAATRCALDRECLHILELVESAPPGRLEREQVLRAAFDSFLRRLSRWRPGGPEVEPPPPGDGLKG